MVVQSTVSRRTALQGLGGGALGLSAAALLGCGGGSSKPAGQVAADKAGVVTGASSGKGLPLNAPVVQGKPRDGGIYLGGPAASNVQHDPHTSLGGSDWD